MGWFFVAFVGLLILWGVSSIKEKSRLKTGVFGCPACKRPVTTQTVYCPSCKSHTVKITEDHSRYLMDAVYTGKCTACGNVLPPGQANPIQCECGCNLRASFYALAGGKPLAMPMPLQAPAPSEGPFKGAGPSM